MEAKEKALQKQFDDRLWALCMDYKKRLGVVGVASTLVVHAARFCAELGPQFIDVAKQKWEATVGEFREELEDKAAREASGDEQRH